MKLLGNLCNWVLQRWTFLSGCCTHLEIRSSDKSIYW